MDDIDLNVTKQERLDFLTENLKSFADSIVEFYHHDPAFEPHVSLERHGGQVVVRANVVTKDRETVTFSISASAASKKYVRLQPVVSPHATTVEELAFELYKATWNGIRSWGLEEYERYFKTDYIHQSQKLIDAGLVKLEPVEVWSDT